MFIKKAISLVLALSVLVSCSVSPSGPGKPDQRVMISESSRMIDKHLEDIKRALEDEGEIENLESYGTITGETVTRNLLEEESGEEYLEFLYNTERFSSVDEVIEYAQPLVSQEALSEIKTEADQIEARIMDFYEIESRALNETQKAEFYKDARKLVIKSVVLLTAALVYAAIPNTILWGKITAATAVSVSAGILASTFMRIIEYKNSDKNSTALTFSDWLKEITTEPTVSWAIAAGVINTGKSLGYSPVTTSIILGIFTVFGIKEDLKPLLEKYNFKV